MVGRREGEVRPAHTEAALAQHLEGGRRAVLHEVAIDVQQALAVVALHHDVRLPDLVKERKRSGGE